ncbi:hypothetical protein [Bacillus cereus]|uniref:hypothetical protein n=1 Tax=Bacillus cereus TaxID=1396 RepID=UPI0018CE76E5|nr:hypothetical protein [Bacillus cereus]MBG9716483.1 hypothetical protein [Bacillus cereus]
MIAFDEKKIQKYIWNNREIFSELITGEIPKVDIDFDISIDPSKLFQKVILEKLHETLKYVKNMDLIGEEVLLRKSGDSTIRTDFLGMNIEEPGICVIELKKSKQTERQAFTELLAYNHHLVSLFPTMGKDDFVNVLISPMEVRTVREAFLHTLLVENKRVIAFVPTFSSEKNIDSLKLELWMPSETDIMNFKSHYFSQSNFEVVKIAWNDNSVVRGLSAGGTEEEKSKMNYISSYVAQIMEEKNIHGFCFTSRSWPELDMPYPNSLIIVGMNPYEISYKNWCMNGEDASETNSFSHLSYGGLIGLEELMIGLKLEDEHIRYFEMLHTSWGEHLIKIGTDSLKFLMKKSNGKDINLEYGTLNLEQFFRFGEYDYAFNYDVFPSSGFKKLHSELLKLDYEFIAETGLNKYPIGDIFSTLFESYKSHHFIKINLGRMNGLDLKELM